jgi:hypothetical protein
MRRLLLAAILAALLLAPIAHAWTWPASGAVLQPFLFDPAHPYAAGQHRGIDVAGELGAQVSAPAAGTVTFAGTVPSSGKSVTISTADGYAVTLTHLGSIAVTKGAAVAEGDGVGTIGGSGDPEVSQPYVHLGLRVAAHPQGYLDPAAFLPPRVAAPPALVPPQPAADPATAASPVLVTDRDPEPVSGAAATASPVAVEGPAPAGEPPVEAPYRPDQPATTPAIASDPPAADPSGAPAVAVAAGDALPSFPPPAPVADPDAVGPAPVAVEGAVPQPGAVDATAVDLAPVSAGKPVDARTSSNAPSPDAADANHVATAPLPVETLEVAADGVTATATSTQGRDAWIPSAPSARPSIGRREAHGFDKQASDARKRPRARGSRSYPRAHTQAAATGAIAATSPQVGSRRHPSALAATFAIGLLLAAVAAGSAFGAVRMMVRGGRHSEQEDPRGAGLAVCGGSPAPGARRGLRRSVGRVRPVSPAEGQRRPHGERNRRARHAGDGGRRPGAQVVR